MGSRYSEYPDERFDEQSRRNRPWGAGSRFRDSESGGRGSEEGQDRYSDSYRNERFREPQETDRYYGRQESGRRYESDSQSGRSDSQSGRSDSFGRQLLDDYSRPYQSGARQGSRGDSRDYGGGGRDYGGGRTPTPTSEWGRGYEGYGGDESWGSGRQSSFSSSYGQGQGQGRSESQMRGSGHRGKGPKGYERTDDRLKELICERLTDDDSVDASNVSVDVSGGRVTLEGTVDSRRAKYDIEECAEQCGAREITNNIRIERQGQSSGTGSSLSSGEQSSGSSASGSGSVGGEPGSAGGQRSGSAGSKESRSSSSKGH